MSTYYRFVENISKDKFFNAIEESGCEVHICQHSTDTQICVTDSGNSCYLWFYVNRDNTVSDSARYGNNFDAETTILNPIAEVLKVKFLSEYDSGYYSNEEEGV